MPGPWIESKANPGWLKKQSYEEGTLLEIRGYDAAKKKQGDILVEVTLGGPPENHLGRLGIRLLAASDRDLNWWMNFGPGKRLRNLAILHFCSGEVRDCREFDLNDDEIFHTDGARTISLSDIKLRDVRWWNEEPGKSMFESSRSRLRREQSKEEKSVGRERRSSPAQAAVSRGVKGDSELSVQMKEKRKQQPEKEETETEFGRKVEDSETEEKHSNSSHESGGTSRKAPKNKRSRKKSRQDGLGDKEKGARTGIAKEETGIKAVSSYESDPTKASQLKEDKSEQKGQESAPARGEQEIDPRHPNVINATESNSVPSDRGEGDEGERAKKSHGKSQRQEEDAPYGDESRRRRRSRSRGRGRGPDETSARGKGKEEGSEVKQDTGKASGSMSKAATTTEGTEQVISLDEVGETESEGEGKNLRPRVMTTEAAEMRSREWRSALEKALERRVSFTELSRYLEEMLCSLDTPLGDFVREFSNPKRPPPRSTELYQRKGNLLPIHPSSVELGMAGVTADNISWLKATLCCLNFHYCAAWARPICVPLDAEVSENQRAAIQQLGETISRNIVTTERLPTTEVAKERLNSKHYHHGGKPVEHMEELDPERVIASWPKVGAAGLRYVTEFLEGDLEEAVKDPKSWWLPRDRMPEKRTISKVCATDESWYQICEAAHARGLMEIVEDSELMKDCEGHFIVNGAGGIAKEAEVDGQRVHRQQFIMVMTPTNEHSMQLPGEQDSFPQISRKTGILLKEEKKLIMSREDCGSASSLFAVPRSWLPHFAFSKKVDAAAFGGRAGVMVRPALAVIPQGWKSGNTVIRAAVRQLVFKKAGIPRRMSEEMEETQLDDDVANASYMDNLDELRRIREIEEEIEEGRATPNLQRFHEVCDELDLDQVQGKQLLSSLTDCLQDGTVDRERGVVKIALDRLQSFLTVSVALLSSVKWKEFQMRHWTGKAMFVGGFKRPLLSILQGMYPQIEEAKRGAIFPAKAVVDEVVCMTTLAVQAEAEVRVRVSEIVSCTNASSTGGEIARASKFRSTGLVAAQQVEYSSECGSCKTNMVELGKAHQFPCPRTCGKHLCSLGCTIWHKEDDGCSRKDFYVPVFGERFSGPNFPLTRAVAMAGISTQRPLDLELPGGKSWDFFTEVGKDWLNQEEMDPELTAEHWSPNCRTFSMRSGRQEGERRKGRMKGPPAMRSEDSPWGLDMRRLSRDEVAKVRQDNKMAKKGLARLKEAGERGRFVSLEHPYESYLWYTEEVKELREAGGFFLSTFTFCCYGGQSERWTGLLHNSAAVHSMIHKPGCSGHESLKGDRGRDAKGGRKGATEEESEYPWAWCQSYARGLLMELKKKVPAPIGEMPRDHHSITQGEQPEDFKMKG